MVYTWDQIRTVWWVLQNLPAKLCRQFVFMKVTFSSVPTALVTPQSPHAPFVCVNGSMYWMMKIKPSPDSAQRECNSGLYPVQIINSFCTLIHIKSAWELQPVCARKPATICRTIYRSIMKLVHSQHVWLGDEKKTQFWAQGAGMSVYTSLSKKYPTLGWENKVIYLCGYNT
jgi:hypothetical protein